MYFPERSLVGILEMGGYFMVISQMLAVKHTVTFSLGGGREKKGHNIKTE